MPMAAISLCVSSTNATEQNKAIVAAMHTSVHRVAHIVHEVLAVSLGIFVKQHNHQAVNPTNSTKTCEHVNSGTPFLLWW
eukprot:m.6006 g.6006  ORF g.6006 m.6006 type:complete len:80 (+) comp3779_c0_seq1:458-697(+)